MANLREPSTAFNRDLLVEARWFAGKGRTVADVHAVSRLEPAGANGATVELVDVTYADGGTERYALALRDGRECAGDDPLWPALARAAGVAAVGGGRFLADDLSNTVVVLDDLHVLKLYRRPEPGTHPEVELLDALAGSPHAPSLEGALAHDGVTLASLQAYVCGEPVGWEPLIARLAGGGRVAGLPTQLARVTAALHRTLAERLGTTRDGLQRIHGDLHVGQFLRAGETLVVVDWEGRPGLTLAERRRPRPARQTSPRSGSRSRTLPGPRTAGAPASTGAPGRSPRGTRRSAHTARRPRAPPRARAREGAGRARVREAVAPRVALRAAATCSRSSSRAAVRHDGFLRDILAAPERLAACLDAYAGRVALDDLADARRVVMTGMGSSRFAALPAAALLRSRGVDAVAELSSTGLPTRPAADLLAVGISASGSTPETVEALTRHRAGAGRSR